MGNICIFFFEWLLLCLVSPNQAEIFRRKVKRQLGFFIYSLIILIIMQLSSTTVFMDWLSLSFHSDLVCVDENIQLKRKDYTTRVFSRVDDVYIYDRKVGVLVHSPSSPVLNPKLCQLKLENKLLYEYDCFAILRTVLCSLRAEKLTINRLDIACDVPSACFNYSLSEIATALFSKDLVYKRTMKLMLYTSLGSDDTVSSISIGSPSSNTRMKLYNKTLEMDEVQEKPWVRDFWISQNVNSSPVIYRAEVTFVSDYFRQYVETHNMTIESLMAYLCDPATLKGLYCTQLRGKFQLYDTHCFGSSSELVAVLLFDMQRYTPPSVTVRETVASGRSDKAFLKRQLLLLQELCRKNSPSKYALAYIVREYIDKQGLATYYSEKLHPHFEYLQQFLPDDVSLRYDQSLKQAQATLFGVEGAEQAGMQDFLSSYATFFK